MDHSYEEIRSVVLDILAGREKTNYSPEQYNSLVTGVAEVLDRREGSGSQNRHGDPVLSGTDRELCREVFWDLFRQGVITLGLNDSNREFPFFRVGHFGKRILENENAYFFHDLTSYVSLIRENIPNINDVTMVYLQEAMQAFKSGCMLASTVMLGVASEHSFLLLLETAEANQKYGTRFASAGKQRSILQKFRKFKAALDQYVLPDLPSDLKEDLDTDFAGILSVIRTFRNESGHPTGKILGREQTYVLLQLFIPYCKRIYRLIDFFK
jgi:hypothetical protein